MPKQGYAIVGKNAAARRAMGERIQKCLTDLGMNQSELARTASLYLPKGKTIGRDSISGYIRGRSIPNAVNLHAIAQALKVKPEALLPEILTPDAKDESEAHFAIQGLPGKPGKVWIRINQAVAVDVAVKIMGILKDGSD